MKIHRDISEKIEELLIPGKVLVLYGPRQVGKTTLVRELQAKMVYRSKFYSGDELIYSEPFSIQSRQSFDELVGDSELIIIDEAQRIPNIGINLKILVDNNPKLRIIATGSASFELANKISEPLTGRKLTLTLYPVSYREMQKTRGIVEARHLLERWMIWGGYPEIVSIDDLVNRERLMNEIVISYLYHDLLELEDIRRSNKINALLKLLAFQIGSTVSIAELARTLGLNFQTVQRYLELLEKVFVIFRVEGFSRNHRKEITKSPRFYFYDLGVRNCVIQNFNPIDLRSDVGQIWENYLMVERLKSNQIHDRFGNSFFWRTYNQKEIDLVEERQGKLVGYEFKYGDGNIRKATRDEFLENYPGSNLITINRKNFEEFVL